MRLLLVRHGESNAVVNGIVGGEKGCTGLTERGHAQAWALGERLAREGLVPDVLLASPLPRAHQTAEAVAAALDLTIVPDEQLVEFIPGVKDGTLWSDWEVFDVVAEPDRPLSEGGESLNVFTERVSTLLARLASEHAGRTVVAVCHGGVIYRSMYHALRLENGGFNGDVDFTSITEWRHGEDGWHLVRFNDVAHLMGSDLLQDA